VKLAASLALSALLVPTLSAAAPSAALAGRHAHPASANVVDLLTRIDANDLDMALTNVGSYAFDAASGNAGLVYPKGTSATAVFAAGLWLGATVGGVPRVTVADYTFEYLPGSAVGAIPEPPSSPWLHVFKLYRTYADPNTRDIVLQDYNQYAVSRGAPVVGVLPDGSLSIRGDQMCWSVCNDLTSSAHTSDSGGTLPLQVEVAQTTWAYDRPGPFGRTVFIEFTIINRGPIMFTDMQLGLWVDPDLGGFSDDLVGCDSTRSLGYCYNADNADQVYGSTPPAVGVDLLQGPLIAAPSHRLPMTAFAAYTNGTDPVGASDSFHSMRGEDGLGNPFVDPSSNATHFMFAGDPVAGTGWRDPVAADKRFLVGSGPFPFASGAVQTIVLALIVGQGTDRLDSVTQLRSDDDLVQTAFDAGTLGRLSAPGPTGGRLSLDRVFPNPARGDLGLAFVLPAPGEPTLELLDLAGRRVLERSLGALSAGPHAVTLAGATTALAPGVYFIRLAYAHETLTRRVAISR
jgi:hypothetical protein